jgi:16S rRNA (guanine1207-N2)-methyltransferase
MNRQHPDASSQEKTISVKVGNRNVELTSPPGLPSWEVISPATQILAENVLVQPGENLLVFGCYHGALLAYFAASTPGVYIAATDINLTALKATLQTMNKNNILSTKFNILREIDLPFGDNEKFDSVIIQPSKGRLLTRRWIVQANAALKPGGRLYLAGSNASGIQSMIKDAQSLFGNGRVLGFKKGNRVALFKKGTQQQKPYWAGSPGIASHTWVEFPVFIKGVKFEILSLPGVFSYDHLDEGTKMLLDVVDIPPGATVLDMGCGYGIIGLWAASNGAASVDLVDNNLLAVNASRETIKANHIQNANLLPLDLLDGFLPGRYDLILSNPPFHIGHAVDYQVAQAMITQSFQALLPGGRLAIVANRFIHYDWIIKNIFGNCTVAAESGKFRVLSGLKSKDKSHR